MHPDIAYFPAVLAAADIFIDAMTLADLLTLGDAPVEWLQ